MFRSLWVVFLLSMGANAMADEQMRLITVNGTGTAEVEPDRATVRMSIIAREPTLDAAQGQVAKIASAVLKMTDRMDIDRDKVDTTGASVRPDYRWNRDKEEQELRGYIAERQLAVELDELDKLGAVIEGAVKAGVNQVSPPQLDSSRRKDTYRRALRVAAEDARANAEQLADTLGARLGKIINVSSGATMPRPPVPLATGARMMAAESDAAATYNPADLSFNAVVTVVFELEDR